MKINKDEFKELTSGLNLRAIKVKSLKMATCLDYNNIDFKYNFNENILSDDIIYYNNIYIIKNLNSYYVVKEI